jgi:hypothetical protein
MVMYIPVTRSLPDGYSGEFLNIFPHVVIACLPRIGIILLYIILHGGGSSINSGGERRTIGNNVRHGEPGHHVEPGQHAVEVKAGTCR